ncbi:hypothetical protein Aura_00217 [Pseudomonas phage vB_PpuM-Aura]
MGHRSKFPSLDKQARELEAMRKYLGLGTSVVTPLVEQNLVPVTTVKRAGWNVSLWIMPKDGYVPEFLEVFITIMDRQLAWDSAIQSIPKTHKLHFVVDCIYVYEVKEWHPETSR